MPVKSGPPESPWQESTPPVEDNQGCVQISIINKSEMRYSTNWPGGPPAHNMEAKIGLGSKTPAYAALQSASETMGTSTLKSTLEMLPPDCIEIKCKLVLVTPYTDQHNRLNSYGSSSPSGNSGNSASGWVEFWGGRWQVDCFSRWNAQVQRWSQLFKKRIVSTWWCQCNQF